MIIDHLFEALTIATSSESLLLEVSSLVVRLSSRDAAIEFFLVPRRCLVKN